MGHYEQAIRDAAEGDPDAINTISVALRVKAALDHIRHHHSKRDGLIILACTCLEISQMEVENMIGVDQTKISRILKHAAAQAQNL
jgi:hypothetical protein